MSSDDDFEDYWNDILPEYVPPPAPPAPPPLPKDFRQRAIESFFGEAVAPRGAWVAAMGPEGEISGEGYARVPFTPPPAEGGRLGASVQFPEARGTWSPITGYAIFDAPEGGNMLFMGRAALAPLNVQSGTTMEMNLTITVD